jgi:hypothetical protein
VEDLTGISEGGWIDFRDMEAALMGYLMGKAISESVMHIENQH